MNVFRTFTPGRFVGIAFIVLGVSLAVQAVVALGASAAVPPPLNVSPHGNLIDGQKISIGVGPNGYFTPHVGVHILECADPGGSVSNLPTDITACDGNTVEGTTILVGADGSFSDPAYPVFLLPSQALGEPSGNQPICDQTHFCVLYAGQDQNDFTAPKVFSAPFLISPSSGTTTSTTPAKAGSGATVTSTTVAPTTSAASTGVAVTAPATAAGTVTSATGASGDLANTGPPAKIEWVAASAMALLLTGAVGRRLALRRGR